MIGLNDRWFVFYWRAEKEDPWQTSQPFTLGEIIDGHVEMEFPDGSSLPMNDVDWASDDIMYEMVPARKH